MQDTFKVGDIVYYYKSPIKMTIESILESDSTAECIWFVGSTLNKSTFLLNELVRENPLDVFIHDLKELQNIVDNLLTKGLSYGFLNDARLTAVAKTEIQKGFIVAKSLINRG